MYSYHQQPSATAQPGAQGAALGGEKGATPGRDVELFELDAEGGPRGACMLGVSKPLGLEAVVREGVGFREGRDTPGRVGVDVLGTGAGAEAWFIIDKGCEEPNKAAVLFVAETAGVPPTMGGAGTGVAEVG